MLCGWGRGIKFRGGPKIADNFCVRSKIFGHIKVVKKLGTKCHHCFQIVTVKQVMNAVVLLWWCLKWYTLSNPFCQTLVHIHDPPTVPRAMRANHLQIVHTVFDALYAVSTTICRRHDSIDCEFCGCFCYVFYSESFVLVSYHASFCLW